RLSFLASAFHAACFHFQANVFHSLADCHVICPKHIFSSSIAGLASFCIPRYSESSPILLDPCGLLSACFSSLSKIRPAFARTLPCKAPLTSAEATST